MSLPDVPSDVEEDELLLHFNDPNYDFDANSSTYFTNSPEPSVKGFSQKASSYMGSSDIDTESRLSSSWPEKTTQAADEDYAE